MKLSVLRLVNRVRRWYCTDGSSPVHQGAWSTGILQVLNPMWQLWGIHDVRQVDGKRFDPTPKHPPRCGSPPRNGCHCASDAFKAADIISLGRQRLRHEDQHVACRLLATTHNRRKDSSRQSLRVWRVSARPRLEPQAKADQSKNHPRADSILLDDQHCCERDRGTGRLQLTMRSAKCN